MTSEPHAPQPHYFHTPEAQAPRSSRELDLVLGGHRVTLTSSGGVFSSERLDLGTRVLLREVPPPPTAGDLLDLGCGWGPLAITQALLAPESTVWAIDVNELALELTAANAVRAGVANVRPVHPDSVPDEVRFAAIWSNPPIRIGKPALHELLLRWLPRLLPEGRAHLVVQRHLGADSLQRWLQETLPDGWTVDRAGSAKGYRVFRITRPAESPAGSPAES
jgi:16S rRNA (guanine1207-N2)-methyltransferase